MRYLFVALLFALAVPSAPNNLVIDALAQLRVPVPECPIAGHATCNDGIDNDDNGVVDDSPGTTPFTLSGSDYVAEFEDGKRAGLISIIADGDADGGNAIQITPGGTVGAGQVAMCLPDTLPADDYQVYVRAKIPNTANNVVWSKITAFGHIINNNIDGSVLFYNESQSGYSTSWIVGGVNFLNKSESRDIRVFSLSGASPATRCIYFTIMPGVRLDSVVVQVADATSPMVTSPSAIIVGSSVVMTADTDEAGTCRMHYGTSSGVYPSETSPSASVGGVCTRSILLGDLLAGTTYYAVMRVTDASGNVGTSSQVSFMTPSTGITRYVESGGSGTDCTQVVPCAISRIGVAGIAGQGDTWIVKGTTANTYSNTQITIDCNAGHNAGTAGNPIKITSENERQPLITTGSTRFLTLQNCPYYTIEGLRVNVRNSITGSGFFLLNNPNLTFRRNLVYGSTCVSGCLAMVWAEDVNDFLFEENELLNFKHTAMNVNQFFGDGVSDRVRIRRNYCNPYPQVLDLPANCFDVYANSSDSIIENNIAEGVFADEGARVIGGSGGIDGSFAMSNLKVLGNIGFGFGTLHKKSPTGTANGLLLQDNVFMINAGPFSIAGIQIRNQTAATVKNNTVIHLASSDVGTAMRHDCEGTITPSGTESATWINNIGINFEYGLITHDNGLCSGGPNDTISFTGLFSNANTFLAGGSATQNISNTVTTDPGLGNCPAFVAAGSPYKGAGQGGADIGANILYAYENGVLDTNKKLWNSKTKQLNMAVWGGAVIAGVNNVNAKSTFGSRFHPSCTFPAGY